MPNKLSDLSIDEVSLVDSPANPGAKVALFKRESLQELADTAKRLLHPDTSAEEPDLTMKGNTSMTPEDLEKSLGELRAENETLKKSVETEKTRADAAEAKAATQKKDEPEPIDAQIEKAAEPIRKEFAELKKRTEEAEAIAKAEREARLLADFTKRAEAELPNTSGKPEEKGALLKRLSEKLEKADFETVLTQLKKADKAMAPNFREVGSGRAVEGSARAQLEARAQEIRKSDPRATSTSALARAMDENPELHKQWVDELNSSVQ
jgi:hypothetical protein